MRRYKAKHVKTRSLQEWVGHFEPKFKGKGSSRASNTGRGSDIIVLIEAGGFYSRKYGITPLMFTVRDTPQDSTGFTPFELLFRHRVRIPMTLLKHLWTGEKEDPEVKTAYQYVLDLRERIEETCQLAQEEISKVQLQLQLQLLTVRYYTAES